LEEITGLCSCGLFVDIEKTFLGASPDGLVDLDSIVEIKCPFAARNTDIKTAIEFFFKYLEMNPREDNKILLKENDNYILIPGSRSTAYEQSPKMLFYCTYTM
jgi:hypothetical protein